MISISCFQCRLLTDNIDWQVKVYRDPSVIYLVSAKWSSPLAYGGTRRASMGRVSLCPRLCSAFARKHFLLPVSRLVEPQPKQVIY